MNAGDYRVYNVERIDYSIGDSDTTFYQLKEVISTPTEQNGIISYRLERFIRENETVEWMLDSVWSTRINDYQAIVVENNMPIIKLSFPVKEGREWDGNAMNVRDTVEFIMQNVDQILEIDGITYDFTLEMIMEEFIDPLQITEDHIHLEFYAKDIGRIYKLDLDKAYCRPTVCDTGGVIKEGLVIEQTLLEFGNIE